MKLASIVAVLFVTTALSISTGAATAAPTTMTPTSGTPIPTTNAPTPDCVDISVEGDATFCIKGPVCSGSGASPAGNKCPVVGDYASDDCYDYLKSADPKGEYCIAPINATCAKIKSGVWACVWNLSMSSSIKTSFAIDGAATSVGSSVGAIVGIAAAALVVAGVAFAAVVYQRKKRAEQQPYSDEVYTGMVKSPTVFTAEAASTFARRC